MFEMKGWRKKRQNAKAAAWRKTAKGAVRQQQGFGVWIATREALDQTPGQMGTVGTLEEWIAVLSWSCSAGLTGKPYLMPVDQGTAPEVRREQDSPA